MNHEQSDLHLHPLPYLLTSNHKCSADPLQQITLIDNYCQINVMRWSRENIHYKGWPFHADLKTISGAKERWAEAVARGFLRHGPSGTLPLLGGFVALSISKV